MAGEAVAWLGLSGWIEGSLQTGLASAIGVAHYFDALPAADQQSCIDANEVSKKKRKGKGKGKGRGKALPGYLELPMLPGDTPLP